MIPFDLAKAPLKGVNLIEAGAGTGKTYTIAGLFLRLIVEQGLGIEQILVVTYTKAATEELKSRIRQRLLEARGLLYQDHWKREPLLAAMAQRGIQRQPALQRIQDALVDFDRAAIFTIHGFCQRVLQHFAFETGHLFEAELVQDAQALIQETADDFWRRYVSRAPAELAHYIVDHLGGPEGFATLLGHYRLPRMRILPPAIKPPLRAIAPWRRSAENVRHHWPHMGEAAMKQLHSAALNARYYGKCTTDDDQAKMTPRQVQVLALSKAMDQWDGTYPVFDRFERMTSRFVAKATRKAQTVPQHPFFDLCQHAWDCLQEMETQLEAYLRYLKSSFLDQAWKRLERKKAQHNILFFDDLLVRIHRALFNDRQTNKTPAMMQGLTQSIQMQYRAALVDEFQDTDPLQYDIFTRLFSGKRTLLFMIGDPKQAIYSFRGADLYAYLGAVQGAEQQYTLTRNWRATPELIQAINTLFETPDRPFGDPKIAYEKAVPARTDTPSDGAPFELWYLTPTEQDVVSRPIAQQKAVTLIADAVGEEIVKLLNHDSGQKHAPEEIAVLVRTHRQAQLIKETLSRRNVPAVLHSAGSVFHTHEAEDLAKILQAAAEPSDPTQVRAALATDMLGAQALELCQSLESPDDDWLARWAAFEDYREIWQRHGFFRMFSRLMAEEGVKVRLLSLPDGERRLTNLLHLAELLHRAAMAQRLEPEGLIKWLAAHRLSATAAEETQQLRLESDAHAVRIITIHKSKGLQFEVVFCPFTWAGVKADPKTAAFHDPMEQHLPTLSIGPGIAPAHQEQAQIEALAENLRLLYVALTRARSRCYMAWGHINGTRLSAPAHLLHGAGNIKADAPWIKTLQQTMAAKSDAQLIADLKAIAERSLGTIHVRSLPSPTENSYVVPVEPSVSLKQRVFAGRIDPSWRIASFSAMTSSEAVDMSDWPDRDEMVSTIEPLDGEEEIAQSIFTFPKGVQTGNFFHDVLEHWDFSSTDVNLRRKLVTDRLRAHGFDDQWTDMVDRLVDGLAQTRLPGHGDGFSLSQVSPAKRINEMEFYFPLKRITAEQLKHTFQDFGGAEDVIFANQLGRLTFAPMHGFMKGYMDMVFEHGDRFYLVDWKSNYLGGQWSDYGPSRLPAVIASHHYYLQYHLYVIALDQWLRQRIEEYSYDRHFGGVFYIFLRGINGPDKLSGIYKAFPDSELVADLADLMIDV